MPSPLETFLTRMFAGRTRGNIFVCSYANDRIDVDRFPARDMVSRQPDQIAKFLAKHDVKGRAVYFAYNTMRGRKRNKDEVAEYNALAVDIDFKGVVETPDMILQVLKGLRYKPSVVVASGHGFHCYWLLQPALGPEHGEEIEELLKQLAAMMAGDVKAAERARVLRLPGSHNSKNGEWLEVTLVKGLCEYATYSLRVLKAWITGAKPLLTYKRTKKDERDPTNDNAFQVVRREHPKVGLDFDELFGEMEYQDTQGNGIDDTHQRIVGNMVRERKSLDEIMEVLHDPTQYVYERDRRAGSKPWNEKEFKSGVKAKFKWCTKRDTQKESVPSEQTTSFEAGIKKPSKLNGKGNHHDIDDGLPDEREQWIAPHDFWKLYPTEKLRRGMMPEIIENVAFEYAERTGMDVEALAMTMLTCCSSLIPTDIKVAAYNASDNKFVESIRIWQANVGDAGSGKSPIMHAVLGPLEEIDNGYRQEFNEQSEYFEALDKEQQKEMDKPVRRRALFPDASVEAATKVFADNPNGLLISYDELVRFFGDKARYSNRSGGGEQSARGFWLTTYDSKRFSSTRIQRGDVDCVPSASIVGGIQPGVIHELIEDASRNDGLVQRFNTVIMPESMNQPREIKNPKYPLDVYERLIQKMHEKMTMRGAILRLSQKAEDVRDRMFAWVDAHVSAYRSSNTQLASHINKYKGMFLRFCGLYHVISHYEDKQPRMISAETANMAYKFMTSSRIKHAEAFYSLLKENEEHNDMKNIAEYILSRGLSTVNVRQMQMGSGRLRKISSRDLANTAGIMVSLGWLKQIQGKQTNSYNWQVNPDVHRVFVGRAAIIKARNSETSKKLKALKPDFNKSEHLH